MNNKTSKRVRVGDRVTIYPRGKNRIYCADFWFEGEHHRRSLKTRNLKVARQRAIQLEADLLAGGYQPAPAPWTLEEAIDAYLDHLKTEDRRPKTRTKYRGILTTFREYAQTSDIRRLSQVTAVLVDQYRSFRKPHLSVKSMHNEGVLLKGFFKWCMERGFVNENPLENMKFKRPAPKPRGGPSLDHVNQILAAAAPSRQTHYAVLAFTGMRSGELQRLCPEDIDLAGNWIHIVSRDGAETKTGHSRKVPIHPRLRPLLEALPKRQRPWLFTASPSRKYPDGNHWINTKHLNEDFLKVLTAFGIPAGRKNEGFSIHSLRNSFETICVNAGIPQRAIDTWLGHQSDRSMASVYYKLTDEASQQFMLQVPFGIGESAANADATET